MFVSDEFFSHKFIVQIFFIYQYQEVNKKLVWLVIEELKSWNKPSDGCLFELESSRVKQTTSTNS